MFLPLTKPSLVSPQWLFPFVDDFDDVDLVPQNISELLDFAEDLDEGFVWLFPSFSLIQL